MELVGEHTFNAPRQQVWDFLLDPNVLQQCLPGCEKLDKLGEDEYAATMKIGIAMIKGTFSGKVKITDKVEPSSYRLTVEGQGKPGFAKGNSAITLRADGDKTVVDVSGTVQTGGPIARVGQRLIGGVSKMMLDRFFSCLQGKV